MFSTFLLRGWGPFNWWIWRGRSAEIQQSPCDDGFCHTSKLQGCDKVPTGEFQSSVGMLLPFQRNDTSVLPNFSSPLPNNFGSMKDAVSRNSHCFHYNLSVFHGWQHSWQVTCIFKTREDAATVSSSFCCWLIIYCSVTVVTYVTAVSCFSPDLSGNIVGGGPCFMKPPKSVRHMRAAWMVKTSGASGALWKPCQSWHAAADCAARYKKHRLHDENATSSQNWN